MLLSGVLVSLLVWRASHASHGTCGRPSLMARAISAPLMSEDDSAPLMSEDESPLTEEDLFDQAKQDLDASVKKAKPFLGLLPAVAQWSLDDVADAASRASTKFYEVSKALREQTAATSREAKRADVAQIRAGKAEAAFEAASASAKALREEVQSIGAAMERNASAAAEALAAVAASRDAAEAQPRRSRGIAAT